MAPSLAASFKVDREISVRAFQGWRRRALFGPVRAGSPGRRDIAPKGKLIATYNRHVAEQSYYRMKMSRAISR